MSRIVWALSSGSYSDYGVEALFANEADCQRVIDEAVDQGLYSDHYNGPESFVLIEDGELGEPTVILQLRAYHNPDGTIRIQESSQTTWKFQEYGHEKPVSAMHVSGQTMEYYLNHKRIETGRQHSYLSLGMIAEAHGSDHIGVRKAFAERLTMAYEFMREMGVEVGTEFREDG